jgi:hypothetical protein
VIAGEIESEIPTDATASTCKIEVTVTDERAEPHPPPQPPPRRGKKK